MNGSKPASSLQKISNFYGDKNFILKNSLTQFAENTKTFPQIGVELEFYLLDRNLQPLQNKADYIFALKNIFKQDATIYQIEEERGVSQIEIKIAPHQNLIELAQKIEKIKNAAKNLAQQNNAIACFDSQPFIDDCGSALQFNFSSHDENGDNLFLKNNNIILNVVAGMLDSIDWAMIFFAPKQEDYLRFDFELNKNLHKKGKFTAPVNSSFGDDNRTTAIRVLHQQIGVAQKGARVEFRVAAADADPYLSIAALLVSIEDAINKNKHPQNEDKIFGNAFDQQYSLRNFAKNLQIAEENFFSKNKFI